MEDEKVAESQAMNVSLGLRTYSSLTSLHISNVALTEKVFISISQLKNLKALVVSYCLKSNRLLNHAPRVLQMATNFHKMPPLESLRLDGPPASLFALASSQCLSLQELFIRREDEKSTRRLCSMLEKTDFPNLRTLTLAGASVSAAIVRRFVSRHRKTLRVLNVDHWYDRSFANLEWMVRTLKILSGEGESSGDDAEDDGFEETPGHPDWGRYITAGFGCVFRDRGEKRELVEFGLCIPNHETGDPDDSMDINLDFQISQLQQMFKGDLFQTVEQLSIIIPCEGLRITVSRSFVSLNDTVHAVCLDKHLTYLRIRRRI